MINRRIFVTAAAATTLASSSTAFARTVALSPGLISQAREALARHRLHVTQSDRIGIADFSQASSQPRFHILDVNTGQSEAYLVAHGKGSDPAHTGWLHSFSNAPGSEATSSGAFLTADSYVGKHGLSRRLLGLDPENSNALSRAIVIHGAWYVSEDMARVGKLGRSQGCFAFSEATHSLIMDKLGSGGLIVASGST